MKFLFRSCLRLSIFLVLSSWAIPCMGQQQISGTVTNTDKMPIPGVNITFKNKPGGTTTNFDGEYELNAQAQDSLVFAYLGYQTQTIAVANQTQINITLQEEENSLGDLVINAGYYTTTERERTGNIAKVTAEEIELQPLVSPLEALQGRMAGVEVNSGGNLPGSAPTIRIRGQNSLRTEGNYPLYIIDGMPINSTPLESNSNLSSSGIDPLSTLNLSNIESIEVLKDADATAIYGSRGANGVVLITTKKGKLAKTEVQARVYTGISTFPNRIDMLDTSQYLQIRRRAFENDGVEPDQYNAYDLVLWDQERNTDWQEEFFGGNAPVTDANISVSGGNQTTSFRVGGAYFNQGTIYRGDYNYERFTGNAQLNHHSKDQKFTLNFKTNYGVTQNELVGYLDLTNTAFNLSPNAPSLFLTNGELNWEEWGEAGLNNPLSGYYNRSQTRSNNSISNLGLSYSPLEGLEVKTNLGYTFFTSRELVKRPKKSYNPSSWESLEHRSTHLDQERASWIIEPQINYNKKISKGTISAIVGATFQKSTDFGRGLYGEGYVTESLIGNLTAADRVNSVSYRTQEYRYAAIFGRLAYNWQKRYYLNLTGRRDGSSRFGPGKQFANFGAVGAAWIFSEENFMDPLKFLSFGKLRASYGSTGNDQIGDYGYLDAYEATSGPGGLYPVGLANPDYSWEVNKKLEVGIQLGFLKDRINMGVSRYQNRSSNQLVGYPLPSITGFTTVQANLGATVENKGWEIEFSSLNFQQDNFSWRTSFNITIPENKLISYPNLEQSSYANTYRIGEPLNISLRYHYEGIDEETGLYQVRDVNGDDQIDYQDRTLIKNNGRQYFGGLSNTLKVHDFSLQFLFQYVKQEGTISMVDAGSLGNQRSIVSRALEGQGQFQTISQSYESSIAYSNYLNTALPYSDASFLRLKTLSLSYQLPERFLPIVGISGFKVFANAQNLFTWTPYEGLDPAMPNGGRSFSALRTISAGVELNF